MNTASDPEVIFISDNHIMARPARAPLRRVLRAPFTRRAWAELAYAVVSAITRVAAGGTALDPEVVAVLAFLGS
jgi:hypothetical protein